MTTYQTIRLEEDEKGIATLTLARSEKHNALSGEMIEELTSVAGEIAESVTIRAVILAAEGKSFCAGGDLNWMKAQADKPNEEKVAEGMKLAIMLKALDDLPKPLIAKVQGNAFGGGVGMMCVCDIVVAAEGTKFGLTETRLGLIPATIGPYVVQRLGEGHARRVFMNSQHFSVDDARRFGLVSDIVPFEELDGLVRKEAVAFLECAPGAVAQAKAFCQYLARTPGDKLDHTAEKLAERWANKEAQDGIDAFFARASAPWTTK